MRSNAAGRLIAGVLMLALAACTAPAPTHTPQPDMTPTPMLDEFQAEVIAKRALWREKGMLNYRIRFEFIEDVTHPLRTYREVYISNASVRGEQCPIGACPTTIFREIQTVTDVFAFMQRIPEHCVVQVAYNRHLHYPEWVAADCADGITHPFALRIRDVFSMG
jgi:hypothetical protein